MRFSARKTRLRAGVAAAGVGLVALSGSIVPTGGVAHAASLPTSAQLTDAATSSGLPPGSIKHVWLIILENKSYDATFTGLNDNSYLWKTLPSQGVELKNYYGTGHSSQDNYLSLVSGQAPEEDVQNDCSVQDYDFGTNATTDATVGDANFGQTESAAGANHSNGQNGCTYPTAAPTLFNQLDAAGVTWKGYAQDLGGASANSPTAAPNGSGTLDLQPGNGVNAHTATAANGNTTSDTQDRDASACGAPGASTNFPGAANTGAASTTGSTSTNTPATYGVTSFTGAQADDQYVAKHFPFGWFHSLIGTTGPGGPGITTPTENGTVQGTDCDSAHIANLDSATNGLVHDLQSEATTPAFSWITPDNCSDAHDAVCKGNNLSGAFDSNGNPIYDTTPQAYDPESTTPTNYTGGLYASDLFLRYYIPLIEQSPAFKDGGLIDVTFDEANPPFTYSGNSFNNQPYTGANGTGDAGPTVAGAGDTTVPANCVVPSDGDNADSAGTVTEPCTPTTGTAGYAPNGNSVYAAYGVLADAAGENINGKNVNYEPTGPNSTLSGTTSSSAQLDPGPGNNAFIDRPSTCTNTGANALTVTAPATCVLGGGGNEPAAGTAVTSTQTVTGSTASSIISDPSIVAYQTGATVTGTNVPANSFVGTVNDQGPVTLAQNSGSVFTGAFQLVDANGNPVIPTGAVTSVTLSQPTDPRGDANDPTPGGGDTGSVLISPYITPGTSSTTYYNHYSWLRTMEDLFNVSSGVANTSNNPVFLTDSSGATYTVAGGLDNLGHLGFAAQAGLTPFGPDVFNNPAGNTPNPTTGPTAATPESPLAVGLPLVGIAVILTFLGLRRRQQRNQVTAA
jgi:hypothetical protein